MQNNKPRIIYSPILQFIFITLILISTWSKNAILDEDAIQLISLVTFLLAADQCVFIYRQVKKSESEAKG